MTRRRAAFLWVVRAACAAAVVLIAIDPRVRVRKGMTYAEVESVLGKQLNGLRPVSLDDGSWTGLWPGYVGIIEVTFGEDHRVRESPSFARRALDRFGP